MSLFNTYENEIFDRNVDETIIIKFLKELIKISEDSVDTDVDDCVDAHLLGKPLMLEYISKTKSLQGPERIKDLEEIRLGLKNIKFDLNTTNIFAKLNSTCILKNIIKDVPCSSSTPFSPIFHEICQNHEQRLFRIGYNRETDNVFGLRVFIERLKILDDMKKGTDVFPEVSEIYSQIFEGILDMWKKEDYSEDNISKFCALVSKINYTPFEQIMTNMLNDIVVKVTETQEGDTNDMDINVQHSYSKIASIQRWFKNPSVYQPKQYTIENEMLTLLKFLIWIQNIYTFDEKVFQMIKDLNVGERSLELFVLAERLNQIHSVYKSRPFKNLMKLGNIIYGTKIVSYRWMCIINLARHPYKNINDIYTMIEDVNSSFTNETVIIEEDIIGETVLVLDLKRDILKRDLNILDFNTMDFLDEYEIDIIR